jgi:hypothetical protein
MEWIIKHLPPLPKLNEATQIHHRDAVTDLSDHPEVVTDEHVRQAKFCPQPDQEIHDLGADGDVKGRDRLVEHEHCRLDRERTGDPNTLFLAARKLMWVALAVLVRKSDRLEELRDSASFCFGAIGQVMHAQHFSQCLRDRPAGVEGRMRILEHHLDRLRESQAVAPEISQLLTCQPHVSGGRGLKTDQHARECGLPTATLANDAKRLATFKPKRNLRDRAHRARLASWRIDLHKLGGFNDH